MMELTANHLKLYISVRDRGVGRICNDLEPEEVQMLTPDQWVEFCKNYHEWNGDPQTFTERTNFVLMDFMVLDFVSHLLIENYRNG